MVKTCHEKNEKLKDREVDNGAEETSPSSPVLQLRNRTALQPTRPTHTQPSWVSSWVPWLSLPSIPPAMHGVRVQLHPLDSDLHSFNHPLQSFSKWQSDVLVLITNGLCDFLWPAKPLLLPFHPRQGNYSTYQVIGTQRALTLLARLSPPSFCL